MKALDELRDYFSRANSLPGEKKLVLKLDTVILSFCCLAYFTNYLDRSSITQAYVSGMKEDLGFEGAQLTEVTTIYAVGYLIGIVPNNLCLTYFKPGRFFPFMITTWALLTMVNAAAQSPKQLMAIRFFQGYFESCTFAGTQYILGSWYTKRELGQRTGIFTASGLAGGMFGGFLQTGIYKSMNGLHGLAGWRWLFIISGIITLPIALYGYIFFPDTPSTTTAFYLTPAERALAIRRVPPPSPEDESLSSSPSPFSHLRSSKSSFLGTLLTSPHLYLFSSLWILGNCSESQSNQSLLNLYMQAQTDPDDDGNPRYSVAQLNNYPAAVQAAGILSTLVWAVGTDVWGGRRWVSGYYVAGVCVGNAVMVLTSASKTSPSAIRTTFAAYYWAGTVYCIQGTFFAWANDSMRGQPAELRACVIACMNASGNLFQAWWPLVFFRADDAPGFRMGMYSLIAVGAAMAIWTTVLIWFDRRQQRAKGVIVQVLEAAETGSDAGGGGGGGRLGVKGGHDNDDKGEVAKIV